jgi:hypothetical protein
MQNIFWVELGETEELNETPDDVDVNKDRRRTT